MPDSTVPKSKCPGCRMEMEEAQAMSGGMLAMLPKHVRRSLQGNLPECFREDPISLLFFSPMAAEYLKFRRTLRLAIPPELRARHTGDGGAPEYRINMSYLPVELGAALRENAPYMPFQMFYHHTQYTVLPWYSQRNTKEVQTPAYLTKPTTLASRARVHFVMFAEAFVRCVRRPGFTFALSGLDFELFFRDLELSGSDVKFDRVYLSNVTDYTSLLPALYGCGPRIKPHPHACLYFNCMTSCAYYSSFQHLTAATLCIPTLSHLNAVSTLRYSSGNTWTQMSLVCGDEHATMLKSSSSLLARPALHNFLKQLFVRAALPPPGPPEVMRENAPLTLQGWVLYLDFLVRHVGYPAHWISEVVEEVLSGTLQGTFALLEVSPNTAYKPATTAIKINTRPFLQDLRHVLGVWAGTLHFCLASPYPRLSDLIIIGVPLLTKNFCKARDFPLYMEDPVLGALIVRANQQSGDVVEYAGGSLLNVMGVRDAIVRRGHQSLGGGFERVVELVRCGATDPEVAMVGPDVHVLSLFTMDTVRGILRFPLSRALYESVYAHNDDYYLQLFHTRLRTAVGKAASTSRWFVDSCEAASV